MARNRAFLECMVPPDCRRHLVLRSTPWQKIKSAARLNLEFLTLRGERVFINYSAITSLTVFSKLAMVPFFAGFISMMLTSFSKRNEVFIEVNDLPYEQSRDLGLPPIDHQTLDRVVFSDPRAHFIFAASRMRDYVVEAYGVPLSRTSVLINGGPQLPTQSESSVQQTKEDVLKFVYAGTMHRGRQIEAMLNTFSGSDHELYLCGQGGEWLRECADHLTNVHYLGPLEEADAHKLVSECDCGLIPYDEKLSYLKIVFPIKASFYITAGIPFLSTKIPELVDHFSDSAIFAPIDQWGAFLGDTDLPHLIRELRDNSRLKQHHYEWRSIIDRWFSGDELGGSETIPLVSSVDHPESIR